MIGIGDLSILSPCKDPQLMAHLKGQEEGVHQRKISGFPNYDGKLPFMEAKFE